jgi:hypothetical protein
MRAAVGEEVEEEEEEEGGEEEEVKVVEEEEVEEDEEGEEEKKEEEEDGRVIMPVISLHEKVRAPVLPTNRTRSDTATLLPSILLSSQPTKGVEEELSKQINCKLRE